LNPETGKYNKGYKLDYEEEYEEENRMKI